MTQSTLDTSVTKNVLGQFYRTKAYQLLESQSNLTIAAKSINFLLIILIMTNVIATIFESESYYHEQYLFEFALFEFISLSIFCAEYLIRVWCCVEAEEYSQLSKSKARLKYVFTPIALIDLIAILPFIIAMFFSIDLRSLRLIRVLRLLKLTHYFKGFNIFIAVIAK